MMLAKQCEQCGKQFDVPEDRFTKTKFCSRSCSSVAGHATRKKRGVSQPQKYTCELCGKVFAKYWDGTATRRFCGVTCRNRYLASRKAMLICFRCPKCGLKGWDRATALCAFCSGYLWSEKEVAYLCEHYPANGAEAVAAVLGRTPVQVRNKANSMHICLTKEANWRIVHAAAQRHMKQSNPMKNPETVQKIRDWRETHPEEVALVNEALHRACQKIQRDKPSGLERRLHSYLNEFGIDFEPSAAIKTGFIVDIRIGNLIIQADGDYWHGHQRFGTLTERQEKQQRRDRAQDAYLTKCGYTVVRIWESDMSLELVERTLREHGII